MVTILIFLGIIICVLGALIYTAIMFFREISNIKNGFVAFITPADEKTPSQLANFFDTLADRGGKIVAAHLKAQVMNTLSIASRQQAGIEKDITQDIAASQNPGMMSALEAFPSLKKRLVKNPGLLQFALSQLAGLSTTQGDKSQGNGKGNQQSNFLAVVNKMNRYGG